MPDLMRLKENISAFLSGKIKNEIPELTGAYIDPVRGALKVTDVTAEERNTFNELEESENNFQIAA